MISGLLQKDLASKLQLTLLIINSIIEERRHIDTTSRSKSSAKKFEYKRRVEEAFRPDIHYNKITKDIFQYNFKKIGFDLDKVSGEGINHYHIRYLTWTSTLEKCLIDLDTRSQDFCPLMLY